MSSAKECHSCMCNIQQYGLVVSGILLYSYKLDYVVTFTSS